MDSIANSRNGPDATLSFSWLHQRVRSYTTATRRTSSRAELWTLGIGIAATVIGLLAVAVGAWLPSRFIEAIAIVCLLIEITAFAGYTY